MKSTCNMLLSYWKLDNDKTKFKYLVSYWKKKHIYNDLYVGMFNVRDCKKNILDIVEKTVLKSKFAGSRIQMYLSQRKKVLELRLYKKKKRWYKVF